MGYFLNLSSGRSSENAVEAKFEEFTFNALRWIRARDRARLRSVAASP
jgi:hypothetical protein